MERSSSSRNGFLLVGNAHEIDAGVEYVCRALFSHDGDQGNPAATTWVRESADALRPLVGAAVSKLGTKLSPKRRSLLAEWVAGA